jgi:tetratricopeptide (TPR) repeat protein
MAMSVHYAEPHMMDPLYETAMNFLQQGDWDNGLVQLDKLILQYPLDHKLRTLRQEMHLRARMDQDEHEDQSVERRRRFTRIASRLWAVILIVVLIVTGYSSVATFIQERIEDTRQTLEHEFMVVEQSAKLRDAQALLRADRPDEALILLEEVTASGVEFPELESILSQANAESALLADYYEGLRQMERQNWDAARNLFIGILDKAPTFRDVSILLADVERTTFMDEILKSSNQNFDMEEWQAAIEGYESIRALDPEFQSLLIEDKLFASYVNAAKATLVDQEDSLQALETAERYFRKALALRPQDPEVKSERELAHLYLKAQNDFSEGLWSEVISGLEIINVEKPDYALGTARQTLYEAYIARGDAWMGKGEYETATVDYQRASVLAKQDPEAVLRLFEAHLKIAEVEGTQGNFESAVFQYRTAIEISDLKTRALRDNAAQAASLSEAEATAEEGNFGLAYEQYRKALGIIPGNYCLSYGAYQEALNIANSRGRMITHQVQEGEYLTMIANRYRSTVCAIVVANDISDPDVILLGQELLIPVLP